MFQTLILNVLIGFLDAVYLFSMKVAAQTHESCHTNSSLLYIDALYAKSPEAAAEIPLEDDMVRLEGPPGLPVETAHNADELRESTYAGASAVFLVG